MLETLLHWDQSLFLFINVTLANPLTDLLMPVITDDSFLRVVYAAAMVILLWRGDKRLRWLVLASALVLALSDQTASKLLKPLIERPRPCHVLANIRLLVECGGGFAMPSSHAANAMGQAFLFSLAIRGMRWYLYAVAALVAISRVFVGVHYPADILVGATLGACSGLAGYVAFNAFERKYLSREES